jgi:L-ascorbate metabolism protein UlaG (beta-lactamase superfamily)
MPGVQLTWLGHAAFRIDSPGGKRVYLDPWLTNPRCPPGEREPERIDILALTHGHSDHLGETIELGRRYLPRVVAIFELAYWLAAKGVRGADALAMNKGGTVDIDGIRFSMTHAIHSGGLVEEGDRIVYLGDAAGYIVEFENDTTVYFAGDTAVFGDMEILGRAFDLDAAVLPIGDNFTMGPRQAAIALELLGVKRCVPAHYGTFPLLRGTPDELRQHAPSVEVLAPEPGETIEL